MYWGRSRVRSAETGQNSRTVMKRVLVDGRRLELPTSALRTSGGNGPIWLSVRDVKDASSRNSSDAETRVFAPVSAWSCTRLFTIGHKFRRQGTGKWRPVATGIRLLGNRGGPCRWP
jgi:hypothetical protein